MISTADVSNHPINHASPGKWSAEFPGHWHKVNDAKHESQSQAFGRAAHDIGAEALLVPSARVAGGMNLVYFPQSLGRGSKVEIFGENDLSVANCYSRSNWRFEQAVAAGLPGVIV